MKLLELEIEHFGKFSGQRFGFGEGGFQLIYGPNEAGKSTLLALVRNLLFGFPHRSDYAWDSHSGEMAAAALIETAAGERIRFRRRKGRGRTVVGEVEGRGGDIDDAALDRLLGRASEELYRHVFGFSLKELAAGQECLEHANLREALYGGGLGGLANFQRVQAAIRDRHEALFAPRATARAINRLLRLVKDKEKELRAALVGPALYSEDKKKCEQLNAEADRLHRQLDDLYTEKRHLERLQKALRSWRRMQDAQAEREQLVVPDGFPRGGAEQFHRTRERLDEIEAERAELEESITETRRQRDALELRHDLIERDAEIRRLVQEVGKVEGFRRDLPLRRSEADAIRSRVRVEIEALNPQWSLEVLDHYRTSLAQRERVEAMKAELDALVRRQTELKAQRPEVAEQVRTTEDRLRESEAVQPLPDLEDLVERFARYKSDGEQLDQLERTAEELRGDIAAFCGRLSASLRQTLAEPTRLPVPLGQTVSEFRDSCAQADQAVRAAQSELDSARAELGQFEEKLATLDAGRQIPGRDELDAQRRRRDEGWRLIRRRYVEAETAEAEEADWLGDGRTLPDQFEQELAAADRIADVRQEKAQLVAQREQWAAAVAQWSGRVHEAERELQARRQVRSRIEQEWCDLWRDCGLTPLSPSAMRDWLEEHARLVDRQRELSRVESQTARLCVDRERYEQELRQTLGDDSSDVRRLLAEARRRVAHARDAASRRADSQRQLPAQQRRLEAIDRQLAEVEQSGVDWQNRWCALLNELGFPASWDVNAASKILTGLEQARLKFQEVASLKQRIDDMMLESEEFERRVRDLCGAVAPDLRDHPAEATAVELSRRLDAAHQAEQQMQSLTQQLARDERKAETRRRQQQELQQQIVSLFAAAGTDSQEEFLRIAERTRRREELSEQIDDCRREINVIRETENEREFQAELQAADADAIANRLRELATKIAEVDRADQNARGAAAVAQNNLDALSGESEAARLELERQSRLAELATAVDEWAPLVLAHALMNRSIDKFEREHQPELQQDVARLMAMMTGGRYVGIKAKLDEHRTMRLEQHDGQLKEPHQLSTGTREQLYLAIRLAYVRHYCREQEPLPIVMDDVLVNFDDARARRTLDVLLELSEQIQVLFLTCHAPMADLVRLAVPGIEPIELAPDFAAAGTEPPGNGRGTEGRSLRLGAR